MDDYQVQSVPAASSSGGGPGRALFDVAASRPRDVRRVKEDIQALALLDPETASGMFYALPRGGKTIEGPSIRLAEIAANAWGNVYTQTRVLASEPDADRFVTVEAQVVDLQSNTAIALQVKRRITDRNGRRFNEDMIQQTAQAASSIALRNAIFRIVPMALVEPIYRKAKKAALGEFDSLEQKRTAALGHFAKLGVTEDRVLAALGVSSLAEVDDESLVRLRGFATAIEQGEASVEAVFGDPAKAEQERRTAKERAAEALAKGGSNAE